MSHEVVQATPLVHLAYACSCCKWHASKLSQAEVVSKPTFEVGQLSLQLTLLSSWLLISMMRFR